MLKNIKKLVSSKVGLKYIVKSGNKVYNKFQKMIKKMLQQNSFQDYLKEDNQLLLISREI
jgi:hypothetical protein